MKRVVILGVLMLGVTVAMRGQGTPPSFTNSSAPPSGTLGRPYLFQYTASGTAPITFSVTAGALPDGLSLSSAGTISGTPPTLGTFTGTVKASNGIAPDATQSFSITIGPPAPPSINNTPPNATLGKPYLFTYLVTGTEPITFSFAGQLPDGLSLTSQGFIFGTPTLEGTFTGTVTASNGISPDATQSFSITVGPPVITVGPPVLYQTPWPTGRVAAGPDGAIWFGQSYLPPNLQSLGRFEMNGNIEEFSAGGDVLALTAGPDGNIWFTTTDPTNSVARLNPSTGAVTKVIPIPAPVPPRRFSGIGNLQSIISGRDGNRIWFTEYDSGKIGSIETTGPNVGHLVEYSLPNGWTSPVELVADPVGNIWFTDYNAGIGKIDPSKNEITAVFGLSNAGVPAFWGITWGPDGNIWVSAPYFANSIVRVDLGTCSQLTGCDSHEIDLGPGHGPRYMATGPDGKIYFTQPFSDGPGDAHVGQVGIIDPSTLSVAYFDFEGFIAYDIVLGPDNNLWFTDWSQAQIGQIQFSCGPTSLSPTALPDGQVGIAYPLTTVTPQGGEAPFSFQVHGLPPGLEGNSPDVYSVLIGGTPAASFRGTISVTAVDVNNCQFTQYYSLTVHCTTAPPTPTIQAPASVCPFTAGYIAAVPISPGPPLSYTWSATPGTTITAGQGTNVVTFTTGASAVQLSVVVTDGVDPACSSSAMVSVPGSCAPSPIVGPDAFTFLVGQENSLIVGVTANSGPMPAHILVLPNISMLPQGVTLTCNHDGTGTLAGTPGPWSSGVYPLKFRMTYADGSTYEWNFTLTVVIPPTSSFLGAIPGIESAHAELSGGGPGCQFSQAAFIPAQGDPRSPQTAPPNGATFPKGLFHFVTTGVCNQAPIWVVLTYATPIPNGTVFWKYGSQPGPTPPDWYSVGSPTAVISGNTVTLGIWDGGLGDDDGIANGVIVDPGGPVIITSSGTPPSFTNGPPSSSATVGTPYSFTYTASGTTPITFTVSAGALPDGLLLSPAGVISGTPTTAGTFTGTVTAANGTAPDATQGFTITVSTAPAADVSISKSVDDASPDVGQNVVFTITAHDSGPSDATGVAVTDLLPAGLSFVSASASQGSYSSPSGVWSVGSLANGASATLSITASVTQTGSIVNTATKTAENEPDPNTANDSATASIHGQPSADVGVGLAADNASPNVGDHVVFTVTASNAGPQDASGVQITDLLPAGVSFVSANPSQGSYDSVSGVWSAGAITKNGSATLAITALVSQSGSITDSVSRTAQNEADLNPANDQKSVTINGQPSADVRLAKSVSNGSPHVGDQVTYTITASDDGPSPASGVQVTDLLPAGLTFVSASASQGSYNSATGLWNLGSLAKNASATLAIVVAVSQTGAITNTAAKSAEAEHDPNPANDSASAGITASAAAPAITTQPSDQTVCSGQTAAFTATASGNPTPTVQWQVSTDGGASFSDLSGATSTTLSFAAAAGDDGKRYRAVFTNSGGSATSNSARLSVHTAPAVTTQPASQSVAPGQTVTFTAAASGSAPPSVQWQSSSDGGATFADVPGATSPTLSFTASASQNGYLYRAVFSNACGSATSNAAKLTVTGGCPVITIQPATLKGAAAGLLWFQELSVSGDGIHKPVHFSLAAGAPSWLHLFGPILVGVPPAPGKVTFTVRATDANGCTGSRTYTLTITCPDIELTPAALKHGTVDRKYSETIRAHGAEGGTFAVTAGTLPPGLRLYPPLTREPDGDRGPMAVLSGTPTQAGRFAFTLTVIDRNGCSGSRDYVLVVDPAHRN